MKIVLKTFKSILLQTIGIFVLLCFACGLLHILSSYFLVNIADKQLNKQFLKIINSGFVKSYDVKRKHHILSTDETVVLVLNPQALNVAVDKLIPNHQLINSSSNSDITVSYHNKISYGLFSGVLHGNFIPMIAFVNTDINFSPELSNLLHKVFAEKTPITIHNMIFLDKSGEYNIFSPKFSYEEAVSGIKFLSQGVNLIVKYNSVLTNFDYKLNIPYLFLNIPNMLLFELKKLVYISKVNHVNQIITNTDSVLNLTEFKLQLQQIDDNTRSKIQAIAGYFAGLSYLKMIENIAFDSFSNFEIDNLLYKLKVTGKDNLISSKMLVNANKLIVSNNQYTDLKFDIDINHILADSFYKLFDINAETNDLEAQSLILSIANNNPSVSIHEISLNSHNGKLMINGDISIEHNNIISVDSIFDALHADINVQVPKDFLSYLFILHMKYFLMSQNTELDKNSEKTFNKIMLLLFNTQIKLWTKKSFITNNNGLLSTKILLNDGVLYFNKHPIKSIDTIAPPKL
jgi:hypothetical protein